MARNSLGITISQVLRRMIRGESRQEAINSTAKDLGIDKTTVHSQCTRGLGLTLDEFEMRAYKLIGSGLPSNKIEEVFIKPIEDAKPQEVRFRFEAIRTV